MRKLQTMIFNELSELMDKHPTLSITDIIEESLEYTFTTRKYYVNKILDEEETSNCKWKCTNEDVYKALKRYNQRPLR